MMSLWDALRMNMMISYQELVRTFLKTKSADKKVFNSVNYLCIIVNKRMTNSITQYPNGPVVQAIRLIYFYFCK
ncbi:hypothetical protein BK332_09650 [Escherichia coli]|nr:hypothetical protein BK332_09650 [Escherichia coli]